MSVQQLFIAGILGSSLLTGCMTSQNWIDDDVYAVKPAEVPIETDITDETDYNAYVFNQRQNERKERYYSDFGTPAFFMGSSMYRGYIGYNPGFNNYSSFGGYNHGFGSSWYSPYNSYGYGPYGYNPYSGYNSYYGYSPYGYDPYYGYSPYYGYNPYNSYGYGNGYYGGGSGSGNHQYSGVHVQGPRGSVAGMGGVSSRSSASVKSATVPAISGGRTVSKPVVSESRAVSAGRTTYTAKPVVSGSTAGRTESRTITGTSAPGRVVTTQRDDVVRPATTTGRSSTVSTPTTVSSPSRTTPTINSGNTNRNSGTAPQRTSTPSSSPSPARSGSSGGSTSGGSKPGRN